MLFSIALCGILSNNSYNVEYDTFDIFSDQDVRENLKKYSNWPTYPQLYVKGKLIGGIDVINELHAENELNDVLNE